MRNAVTHPNICLDELHFSLLLQPLLHENSRHAPSEYRRSL